MPRISYVDPRAVEDPEIRGYLEYARQHGTPRPESQAIRAHCPNVIRAFSQAWDLTFRNGVLDHRIYVSKSVECSYCGLQRSVKGRQQGLTEDAYDELLDFASSGRYSEREKAALAYTNAIVWDANLADDALWERLHRHFTEPELVELGFFVALTLGQQRWIKTLGIGHRQLLADTDAGLAPTAVDIGIP
jgi:hypothetical protein